MSAVVHHRQTQGVVAVDLRSGDRRPPAGENGIEQAAVETVRVTVGRQVPVGDDGQVGVGTDLPTRQCAELCVEVAGEEQLLF